MKLTLLFALVLTACAPVNSVPPPPATSEPTAVRLHAERVSATSVRLTLDNGSTSPIGYNLCTSTLERRSGTTWTNVPTDEMCTMQLSTLNPGRDATFEKRLASSLPAGDYRYVTSVESPLGGSHVRIATEPFTIR